MPLLRSQQPGNSARLCELKGDFFWGGVCIARSSWSPTRLSTLGNVDSGDLDSLFLFFSPLHFPHTLWFDMMR